MVSFLPVFREQMSTPVGWVLFILMSSAVSLKNKKALNE
jgi:hypothetical protein